MQKQKLAVLVLVMLAIVLALFIVDLLREPALPPIGEIAIDLTEKLLLVVAMAGVAWTMTGLRDLQDGQVALSNNLARAVAQGDAWREQRRDEIQALGRAIEDQFRVWRLTPAEIDIAGLMLKGASLKEIALARDTSEATIRQQAQAIYRKSGLSGRTELSAYFLETLFATSEDRAAQRATLNLVSTAPGS